MDEFLHAVIASVIYCVIGIAAFGIAFLLIKTLMPFSLRKEIEDDQNVALGIVLGSVFLGLSIIIAAAVGG